VLGEPGVGKTRLAEEVVRAAEPVRVVRCDMHPGELPAPDEPTMVLLEDLHKADDATLDAVDDLVARTSGVLVLATARPDLRSRRPAWPVTLTLAPLPRDKTEELLAALLDRSGLHGLTDVVRSLADDVGGNPLFAVEYVRMLRDDLLGDIPVHADARMPVPGSVHGIVAARLDSLSRCEKNVLQDAAVLGDAASADMLAAVGDTDPTDVTRTVERLAEAALLRKSDDGYRIGSTPLRDVACSQLPRPVRADKSVKAAEIRQP
jgi:predicted ATPase